VAVFSKQVQKTQTLDKKKKKKTATQTYNTITRNRKDKKQPYRTKKTNIRQVIQTYKTIR
jgi:hypothetical protein